MVKYNQDKLSTVFQALADPTRRSILENIAKKSITVLEIAKPFKMSLPAVSKHLKVLESAGLIKRNKVGRTHYFEVIIKPIENADEWIKAYQIYWKERLVALEKYLKGRNKKKG